MAEPSGVARPDRVRAMQPNDLERFFIDRANAGDLDGLVDLYEPNAVLMPASTGHVATGKREIRDALERMLTDQHAFVLGDQRSPIVSGDLALTSTRLTDGAVTAEVARRQPDGSWLWVIDRYSILE